MLRDSCDPGVVLHCTGDSWRALTEAVRAGEFDDLG